MNEYDEEDLTFPLILPYYYFIFFLESAHTRPSTKIEQNPHTFHL